MAILLVVLFHAGVASLGGGYVGVDVFFVLSGFLITGLLWGELRTTGRIRFSAFYARRARRLLPASVFVLLVTLIASAWLLSPLRAQEVTKDAQAAAVYGANYRYAQVETDYLGSQAPPSPLLHYWSLAVEEQFYVVWPLALGVASLLWMRRRRSPVRVGVLVALIGVTSFLLSIRWTHASAPWAFFSLPTRAWELSVGEALALSVGALRRLPPVAASILGWCGMAAIGFAAVGFDNTTPFPGTAALFPVLGTAAVVGAGCATSTWGPARVLAWRPLQGIGRLSYSWYLWHWPILVIAAAASGRELSVWENLGLVGVAGLLSLATYVWVENPVRYSPRLVSFPWRSLLLGAGLTMAAVVAAVVVSEALPDLRGRGKANVAPPLTKPTQALVDTDMALDVVRAAVARGVETVEVPANLVPSLSDVKNDHPRTYDEGCHLDFEPTESGPCVYGSPLAKKTVVLYGDSHAAQWFPALERLAEEREWRLLALTKSGCVPVEISLFHPTLRRTYTECDEWRATTVNRIIQESPDRVVIATGHNYPAAEWHVDVYGEAWLAGLEETVRQTRTSGADIVLLGDTPYPGGDVPGCLSTNLGNVPACITAVGQAINVGSQANERTAVEAAGGRYLDPTDWFCTEESCPVVVDNLLVYRDDNHLTTPYSRWLAPVLGEQLGRLTTP